MRHDTEVSGGGLRRDVGLATATAVVVGEVIGVGIFLTPAGMAKSLGSPFWLLVVWLLMALTALCGALCYGELASRFPEAGGGYVYLRETYGRAVAFLYGWTAFLVIDPGLTAAFAAGLAGYAVYLTGLSPVWAKVVGVAAIVFVAAVNVAGVRAGGWLVRWLTVLKLSALGLILVWGFALGLGDWSHFEPLVERRPGSAPLLGALAGALVAAFFSFGGWWDVSKLAGEVRDPARNLPRALVAGVLVVTVVYVLTSAVFIYLVAPERVTTAETFAAQAGEALFGRAGGVVFSAAVVLAVLGSLAGFVMSAPRVYFAMARDGLFFEAAARIHPRFGTPALAITLQAALACLLVLLGTFEQIISFFVFAVVLFIALTAAALFVLRRREAAPAPFEAPGYPFTPLVFLLSLVLMLFLLGAGSPVQAFSGAAVALLGLPVYYFLFRGGRRAAALNAGPATRPAPPKD
ncbi:MAG TPA: amino acid permease [Pyrinomonadaceae bacterium]|nr:amino acid permease [Pyrinomonadaceae bacterium]